jgi:hypothetical protein
LRSALQRQVPQRIHQVGAGRSGETGVAAGDCSRAPSLAGARGVQSLPWRGQRASMSRHHEFQDGAAPMWTSIHRALSTLANFLKSGETTAFLGRPLDYHEE